jgi:O-antigen ligase
MPPVNETAVGVRTPLVAPNAADSWRPPRAPSTAGINTLILFFILEYARPYVLAQFKLQMLIVLGLPLFWLMASKRPWSSILTAQALFCGICLVEIPLADNYYAAYFTARTMLGHFAIALGLSWLLTTRPAFRRVTWAWLFIITYVALFGMMHGGHGPGAMLGDENDLALGCGTAFPLAFYGFEQFKGRTRLVSGVIAVLLVAAVVISFSRGGLLGLLGAVFYSLATSRHRVRNTAILTVACVLVVVLAPATGRKGGSYLEVMGTIGDSDEGTAKGRRFLWQAATNMWKAHPILGVGGGNFAFNVGRYQPMDFEGADYQERDWSGTVTHSTFYQILAEHGTTGILLLAWVIFAHFRTLRRLRRDVRGQRGVPADLRRDVEIYAGGLAGAVAAYCVAGAFLSVGYYPYLWYFSAMAVGLNVAVRQELSAIDATKATPLPAPAMPAFVAAPVAKPGSA